MCAILFPYSCSLVLLGNYAKREILSPKQTQYFLLKKTTKKTTKRTTLKPINKGKFNDRKPPKRPPKEPVNLFTNKNNYIDYQLITKISKKRLKKICIYKINPYLYIRKQTYLLTLKIYIMKKLTYIGTYKVYKIFRKSGRRKILARGLTRKEAKSMAMRYKDSNLSMVVFDEQFTSSKYYKYLTI